MCLEKSTWRTRNFKKSKVPNVIVYKHLTQYNGVWQTPYQCIPVKPGQLLKPSLWSRIVRVLSCRSSITSGAIHAYTHTGGFRPFVNSVLLKCVVPSSDVIALGVEGDIALKKLQLPSEFVCCVSGEDF